MRHARRRLLFWLCWPGLFVYYLGSRRARVFILDGTRVLLVQDRSKVWFDDDRWAVPGGGVHRRERVEVGAARELREELGIVADPAAMELLWSGQVSEYGLRYRAHFLILTLPETTQLSLQSSEIATVCWFDLHEMDTLRLKPEARDGLQILARHR